MKTPYRPPRELLAELDEILARKYSPTDDSPLDQAVELLHEGRHYYWTRIYLVTGARADLQASRGPQSPGSEIKSKVVQPIKIVGRVLGEIVVESDRDNAFSPKERVLLKEVGKRLARFLTGRGKYLVRKAKEAAAAARVADAAENPERHQPASERAAAPRAAAAGEKSRS